MPGPSMRCIAALLLICLAGIVGPLSPKDQKIKAEDLVSKHLASIGSAEAFAAVRNRATSGTVRLIFRLGNQGQLEGKGNIISEGRLIRIGMNFLARQYSMEQLAYDGEKVTVGQIEPGRRSQFSEFVYQHDVLLKEGLLGGTTTTAWALLDTAGRQPKLSYNGLKKFEGRQLHELRYKAKKGQGDLQVSLYFEPETFHHVASQYRLTQPPPMAPGPVAGPGPELTGSGRLKDTIYTIVEQFGDFKAVDSLTLPHSCKMVFTVEGQNQTFLTEWDVAITQVAHNAQMDPKFFVVQ